MRLSRILRILQIKEGVIHRGRRPRWITPSEICRIPLILRKLNPIIALLFIQNFPHSKRCFAISLFVFPITKYNTTLSPGFVGEQFNNLQRAALLTSFCGHRFNILSTAAGYLAIIEWGWVGYEEFCRSIKEGVIHRGRRPRWITPSEICRILHILWKPNSIIVLLFIQNISSFLLKEFRHYALCFSAHQI